MLSSESVVVSKPDFEKAILLISPFAFMVKKPSTFALVVVVAFVVLVVVVVVVVVEDVEVQGGVMVVAVLDKFIFTSLYAILKIISEFSKQIMTNA